jgi:hypothetical protein
LFLKIPNIPKNIPVLNFAANRRLFEGADGSAERMSGERDVHEVLDPIEGEEDDAEFEEGEDENGEDGGSGEDDNHLQAGEVGNCCRETPKHFKTDAYWQLFGNDEEEESDSDYDMNQYRPVSDFDVFGVHRAAEEGNVQRLREAIERYGERPERRDVWGMSPLHTSIIAGSFECFLALLDWPATVLEATCQGSPLPHVILSAANISKNAEFGLKALHALLEKGANKLIAESKDEYERTPLRLACELGLEVEFIQLILTAVEGIADVEYRTEVLSTTDRIKKWNALHAAADIADPKRRFEIMAVLLSRGGFADVVNYFDAYSRTSLHVLVHRSGVYSEQDPCCELLISAGVNQQFKDVLGREASAYARDHLRQRRGPTAIFSHEVCSKHYTAPPEDTEKAWFSKKDVPPENVNRLLVLLNQRFGTLQSRRIATSGAVHDTAPPRAEMGDILRVHDWGYVLGFKAKCDQLEDEEEIGELDGDTTFSKLTYDASLIACGSAIEAVERVVTGKIENAFCAVRPPGHHAGPSGICGGCTSHGFCFLNNVAIAASYAMDRHRDKIRRVAIVGEFSKKASIHCSN